MMEPKNTLFYLSSGDRSAVICVVNSNTFLLDASLLALTYCRTLLTVIVLVLIGPKGRSKSKLSLAAA